METSSPFDSLLFMQEKEIKDVSLSAETIRENVYIIRGQKVMLDRDLAMLYGVPTMRLNQSVKRNLRRFPEDFMFQLTKEEVKICSRSQIVILNDRAINNDNSDIQISNLKKRGKNIKYMPMAFTEHGIAMLSSVLNSKTAIQINIQIIRVFTKMREMIDAYKDLKEKVEEMELSNEATFNEIFKSIRLLTVEKKKPKVPMGFVDR